MSNVAQTQMNTNKCVAHIRPSSATQSLSCLQHQTARRPPDGSPPALALEIQFHCAASGYASPRLVRHHPRGRGDCRLRHPLLRIATPPLVAAAYPLLRSRHVPLPGQRTSLAAFHCLRAALDSDRTFPSSNS